MDERALALLGLGQRLRRSGYRFVAVTPATHRLVLNRPRGLVTLQSIFGWNIPFTRTSIDADIFDFLATAEALESEANEYRATVRFATIGDLLFLHSGFPTIESDAVFFGPDTYRFTRLLRHSLGDLTGNRALRLVDIGSGSGAGGIFAARLLSGPVDLVLADINKKALRFSAINAALNEVPVITVYSNGLNDLDGDADIIIANPPYLVDEEERMYRHGGGDLGIDLAMRIAEESLARLLPGGRMVLYAGVPIIAGADPLFEALRPLLKLQASQYSYEEIDPDVFGEELGNRAYTDADRIAVVGLTVVK